MTKGRRIVFRRTGGPEVLEAEAFDPGAPGEGEVLVEQAAIGVNFIDTYHRTGLYPRPLPATPGGEGAGTIVAVGAGVTGLAVGDRIGWVGQGQGYATHRRIAADIVVPLPDAIDFDTAAAALLKGMTAWMLIERVAKVKAGEWVLVHAAAGGVGSILVQWLAAIGARVIAHAGTAVKADKAKAFGAHTALSCLLDELAAQVRAISDGAGVAAVLDGVGKASWDASLGSVARRGLIVTYGNASGPVPPVPPLALSQAGSVFLTRPTLFDYTETAEARRTAAARLFEMIGSGAVSVPVGLALPLDQAAEAHRRLEARETTGSVILRP